VLAATRWMTAAVALLGRGVVHDRDVSTLYA
jgi:hypothetical protein